MSERSEQETLELLLEWLRKYGSSIILGIIISLVGNFSYRWYEKNQNEKAQIATSQLITLSNAKNKTEAQEVYEHLKDNNKFKYLATQLYAKHLDNKEALPLYQIVSQSDDDYLQQSAKLKITTIYLADKNYDLALKELENLRGGIYKNEVPILQGMIYEQQNRLQDALNAFESAPEIPEKINFINRIKAKLITEGKS